MNDPKELIQESLNRLREIVWWNVSATRLHQVVSNPEDIPELLVEAQGPFVERVLPPAAFTHHGQPEEWAETASRLEIDRALRKVVDTVLFRGQSDLSLYYHQGQALELLGWRAIENHLAPEVVIITVPTASGKTESFLLPILDASSQYRRREHLEHGRARAKLRALFLYPMKTLAADQVNRFVRYLYELNENLKEDNVPPIRLGIWDGDTPYRVGAVGDEETGHLVVDKNDHARGLRCPRCEKPLLYREGGRIGCESHEFPWLSLTRQDIKDKGVDLLVTNPEAIEYLLANPSYQQVLESDVLRHIVVDEAHTWNGVEGTSFGLLLMRLRSRYPISKPHMVLSSATVADPLQFASDLLQLPRQAISAVDFRSRLDEYLERFHQVKPAVNYERIPVTTAHQVVGLLVVLDTKTDQWVEVVRELTESGLCPSEDDVRRALRMAELLTLVRDEGVSVDLTVEGRELTKHIPNHSLQGFELVKVVSDLTDHPPFVRDWAECVALHLPELLDLVERFFSDSSFAHEEKLQEYVQQQAVAGDARAILLTLLSMGRVADLVFDKYHVFLKPVSGLTYCVTCRTVQRTQCKAGHQTVPLQICDRCHSVGLLLPKSGASSVDGASASTPIIQYLSPTGQLHDHCRCVKNPQPTDVFLHYQTFASYLISTVPALLPSRKMLLFADGRGLVDLLVDLTQTLEYSLVADRLIAYHVAKNDGITVEEIEAFLIKILFQVYKDLTPLKVLKEQKKRSDQAEQLLKVVDKATSAEIYSLIRWTRKGRLFDPAIVTFDAINLAVDPVEKSFVHVMMREIMTAHPEDVEDDLVPVVAVEKLKRQLEKFSAFGPLMAAGKFDYYYGLIKARYGLHETAVNGERRVTLPDKAKSNILLFAPTEVTYCVECFTGVPARLDRCVCCGSSNVVSGNRLSTSGFLANPTADAAPYALDHWAHDILGPALRWTERLSASSDDVARLTDRENGIERVVVLSHRGGVPMAIRSAIETGFRDSTPPTVNVVCATPTMEMGIDIGTLDCIGQLGIPPSKASYMQRVGRTGRKMATPSTIYVTIRNDHAVDGFYFGDLEQRFLNRPLTPARVPRPPVGILVTHVLAEVLNALSRLSGGTYKEYYILAGNGTRAALAGSNVENLFKYIVKAHIGRVCRDVRDNLAAVRKHLVTVFGHIDGFEPNYYLSLLFSGSDALVPDSLVQFFSRLDSVYRHGGDSIVKDFVGTHRVLLQLFSTLGLAPRFRGGGSPIPISDPDGNGLMVQSAPYALRENAPGPFTSKGPERGALWRVEGRGFQMHYAMVHAPALTAGRPPVKVCWNEKCEMPFHPYSDELQLCPFCNTPLEQVEVFEYAAGVGKRYKAPPFNRIIETTAFVQSHIEEE